MSCRSTIITSMVFSLLRQDYLTKEKDIQDSYHNLYASSHKKSEDPVPTRQEVIDFLDSIIARFKKYPVEQAALIAKAEAAKNDPIPDSRTWFSLVNLEKALVASGKTA